MYSAWFSILEIAVFLVLRHAVGTALARNPFPLIIPCHRVVRSDGMLGDFGGGLKMKKAFLEMEGVAFDRSGRVQKAHLWS